MNMMGSNTKIVLMVPLVSASRISFRPRTAATWRGSSVSRILIMGALLVRHSRFVLRGQALPLML
jgi:hypothetical protein